MPHVLERAPTARAKCRGCGAVIAKGHLRLGERVPNPFADEGAETTHWYHVACGALTRPAACLEAIADAAEAVDDRDALEREARLGIAHERLPRIRAADRAPTGRATCRCCREPIGKDTWRIGLASYEEGRFVPAGFVHAMCAREYFGTTDVLRRIRHFSPTLSEQDLGEIENAMTR